MGATSDEPAGDNEDEIDEFIKRHLEDDEEEQDHHEKLTAKAKEMLSQA